ncbi:hypothetical protein TNCT_421731 [Trichonephila clavata]|uniref:Uncharacterized protein n=1 Tax=Trichonephila clavata TaxID=2740835 RepID=A0A8X6IG99_TRICU|nr:hypothetical protein TNCT_421731 [Trichonephila clavata]
MIEHQPDDAVRRWGEEGVRWVGETPGLFVYLVRGFWGLRWQWPSTFEMGKKEKKLGNTQQKKSAVVFFFFAMGDCAG